MADIIKDNDFHAKCKKIYKCYKLPVNTYNTINDFIHNTYTAKNCHIVASSYKNFE